MFTVHTWSHLLRHAYSLDLTCPHTYMLTHTNQDFINMCRLKFLSLEVSGMFL